VGKSSEADGLRIALLGCGHARSARASVLQVLIW